MQAKRLIRSVLLLVVLTASSAAWAHEEKADPLFELVGEDAGFCVHVSHLSRSLDDWCDSPLYQRLQKTGFYREWLKSDDYKKLQRVREAVEKVVERPLPQLRKELFGESVVVAVYADSDGKPAGILLTRASDASTLESILAAWNRNESSQTVQMEHAGRTFVRRTKASPSEKKDETLYYFQDDRLLALSDNERLIRRTIEHRLKSIGHSENDAFTERKSLGESPVFRKAWHSLSSGPVVSFYLNPRSWDHVFQHSSENSPDQKRFAKLWQRCQSLAVGLHLNQGVQVEAVLNYRAPESSEFWKRLIQGMQGTPKFFQKVPRHALVAFSGRFDWTCLEPWLKKEISEKGDRQWRNFLQVSQGLLLGLDLFDDVLPHFQTNWGIYFVPRSELVAQTFPVDALMAIEFEGSGKKKKQDEKSSIDVHQALDNGLNTGLNLWAAFYNSKVSESSAIVETEESEWGLMRWIDSLGSYQPAYALTPDYLILSSSPRLIRNFVSSSPAESLVSSADFRAWSARFFPDENQVLFIDLSQTRRFLSDNRQFFIHNSGLAKLQKPDEVEKNLLRIEEALSLFDAGFAAGSLDSEQMRLVLGGVLRETEVQPE